MPQTHRKCGIENVVQVDWHEFQEPVAASRGHRVAGMVSVCPGIRSRRQTPVRHQIQHTLNT